MMITIIAVTIVLGRPGDALLWAVLGAFLLGVIAGFMVGLGLEFLKPFSLRVPAPLLVDGEWIVNARGLSAEEVHRRLYVSSLLWPAHVRDEVRTVQEVRDQLGLVPAEEFLLGMVLAQLEELKATVTSGRPQAAPRGGASQA
ncbi:hypothetical protein [Promicromonospora sp. NFX87]|uniref:hypothetical protein n=1 Tax=Promicromonospora sp. NFX87 TaxID=3402691 RepID=UPI003AFB36A2